MESRYVVLLAIIGAAVGIYGTVTGQVLVAGLFLGLILLVLLYYHFRTTRRQPGLPDDGWFAIILAAIVAWTCTAMHAEFLLWAVAIAALFLIQQSLARIEKRLGDRENP